MYVNDYLLAIVWLVSRVHFTRSRKKKLARHQGATTAVVTGDGDHLYRNWTSRSEAAVATKNAWQVFRFTQTGINYNGM